MSVTDIYNFVAIDDHIATSGQPTDAQFRDARAAGYEVVINLAPDGLETSLPGQAELLDSLGIAYHHIPVAWTDPNLDQLDQFVAAMDASAEQRTLVHCQANYRVTAFFGLYAEAKLGWTRERADALIDGIWSSNPGYEMDATWQGFLTKARQRSA